MRLTEVLDAMDEFRQNDELSGALGWCKRTTVRAAAILKEAFPNAHVKYLIYHNPDYGPDGDHYSVKVTDDADILIINLVPAPGFPEYIGDAEQAEGLFGEMTEIEEVA